MNKITDWINSLYEFLFILAVCSFGFVVQIGYMYLKDKILPRKKIIVLFFINLSISYALNKTMIKLGWAEWVWLGIWFYNANSIWLMDLVTTKLKSSVNKLLPEILESWLGRLKNKDINNDSPSI